MTMLLADDWDDEEETITIRGTRSAPRLRLATPNRGPSSQHLPGRVEPGIMLGNYSILRCIARGGMASVWVARHRSARGLSKLVTLKTILPELAAEPAFEEMFLREARLASLIHHPNVCETFELIESAGVLALSMEWVDGASLSRMLAASPAPLDARIAVRIAAQAAAGLHAAHELRDEEGRPMNLVHRDVSPQNILMSRDGHVLLSDFGIAKAMSGIRELSSIMRVQGKASYLSPEQARNEPLDRRSDIFSLGVVLYLAALGRRPFARPDERDERAIARLLSGELTHPLQVDPSFSPALAEIIVRSLQKDPARRYATAADMRQDLELWLATSGRIISEQDVAGELQVRCGRAIEQQQLLIRAALSWDEEAHPKETTASPASARRTSMDKSGTFPSSAVREPPTAPLALAPRATRLSWAARATVVGALALAAASVGLWPEHHPARLRSVGPPLVALRLARHLASRQPVTQSSTRPLLRDVLEQVPPGPGGQHLVHAPKQASRGSTAPPRSQPTSRPGRHQLGPVERDL
jgi:eukaryotic-like serine/threonine-protein kinase